MCSKPLNLFFFLRLNACKNMKISLHEKCSRKGKMPQYNSKHKSTVVALWMFILFLWGLLINRGIGFLFKGNLELLLHQLGSNSMCFTHLLSKHPSQDSHTCPLLTLCKKTNKIEVVLMIPVLEIFSSKISPGYFPCVVTEKQQVHNRQRKDHFDSDYLCLWCSKNTFTKLQHFHAENI